MPFGTPLHLDLLRHGETRGGARFRGTTDDPLTPAGWKQMWAAVDGLRWEGIVSSPLNRCAAFACALARRCSIPLTLDQRLTEMCFGAWEGRTAADLMAADPEALGRFWDDPTVYPPPGGEPFGEFQARVLSAWDALMQNSGLQRLLIIAHGGPIRVILGHVLGMPHRSLLGLTLPCAALSRVRLRATAGGRRQAQLVFYGRIR